MLTIRSKNGSIIEVVDGEAPIFAVLDSWKNSIRKWIILNSSGIAVAVLGVRTLKENADIGAPWLLGTDGLNQMKRFFVKHSKVVLKEICKGYKLLINRVDARYIEAIRWLEWCGFTIEEPREHGNLKVPFSLFYMTIDTGVDNG
jgi:hypothetical protein